MNSIASYTSEQLSEIDIKLRDNFKQPRFVWEQEFMEMNEFMRKLNHYFYKYAILGIPSTQNNFSRVIPYSTMLTENKRTQIVGSNLIPVFKPDMLAKDYEKAVDEAMYKQTKIQHIWDDNDMKVLASDIVLDGVHFNAGFLKVYTDNGDIKYKRLDWRDVYFYPTVWNVTESPLVGRRFTGIIGEYAEKEGWIIEGVQPARLYQDDMSRNSGISVGHEQPQESPIFDLNLFEGYEWETQVVVTDSLKRKLASKYPWIKEKDNGTKITRSFATAQNRTIHDEWVDYGRSSIFSYCPQSTPLYAKSMGSRIVGTNKSYDNLVSHAEMFMAFANKYRVLIEKGSEVNDMDNLNAQKLYYRGTKPEVMRQDQLSVAIFDYMSKLEQTMQIIMNMSASSLGQMASGSKGKMGAMNTQKQQDLFNTSYPVDKLKSFLNEITTFSVGLLASNTELEDIAYHDGIKPKKAVLIGANYKSYQEKNTDKEKLPEDWDKNVVITGKEEVDVQIQSGLNYVEGSMAEKVAELVKADPINYPPEMLALAIEDPRLDYYIKLGRKLAAQDKQNQVSQASQQLQNGGQQPQQGDPNQQQNMQGDNQQSSYDPHLLQQAINLIDQMGVKPPQQQEPMNAEQMKNHLADKGGS